MKSLVENKVYFAIGIIVLLFVIMGTVSLYSINLLQGNARVVNHVGIVRGATQKLVKEELMSYPDDQLIAYLDGIVNELITGEGANDLIVLEDAVYLENMRKVKESWSGVKQDIEEVRAGGNRQELYDSSQEYFTLVNETVFSAEEYSEKQVSYTYGIIITINAIFLAFLVVATIYAIRSAAVKRRAEVLGKLAYIDTMTEIENRASCERLINKLRLSPPEADVWAFMFDMNDLKLTNDFLGHQGGDKVIKAFAEILCDSAKKHGFLGRYGGDEFLGIFTDCDEDIAREFLRAVKTKTNRYNNLRSNKLEQISYAAGCAKGDLHRADIEDVIREADNQMYLDKRRIKRG